MIDPTPGQMGFIFGFFMVLGALVAVLTMALVGYWA